MMIENEVVIDFLVNCHEINLKDKTIVYARKHDAKCYDGMYYKVVILSNQGVCETYAKTLGLNNKHGVWYKMN